MEYLVLHADQHVQDARNRQRGGAIQTLQQTSRPPAQKTHGGDRTGPCRNGENGALHQDHAALLYPYARHERLATIRCVHSLILLCSLPQPGELPAKHQDKHKEGSEDRYIGCRGCRAPRGPIGREDHGHGPAAPTSESHPSLALPDNLLQSPGTTVELPSILPTYVEPPDGLGSVMAQLGRHEAGRRSLQNFNSGKRTHVPRSS